MPLQSSMFVFITNKTKTQPAMSNVRELVQQNQHAHQTLLYFPRQRNMFCLRATRANTIFTHVKY